MSQGHPATTKGDELAWESGLWLGRGSIEAKKGLDQGLGSTKAKAPMITYAPVPLSRWQIGVESEEEFIYVASK